VGEVEGRSCIGLEVSQKNGGTKSCENRIIIKYETLYKQSFHL